MGRQLGQLTAYDIHALHDRHWPGTRNANVDHLVVGTSGVFVVDTKDWSGELEVTATGVLRGQESCDDELDKVRRAADAIRDVLVDDGLPPTQVVPVVVFLGRQITPIHVNGVWVTGSNDLCRFILTRGKLLTQTQTELLLTRLMATCPPAAAPSTARVPRQPLATPEAVDDGALFSRAELDEAAFSAAMQAPLADWMTFLHPSQARLVKRSMNGPARISGPAGTGKSVVALHRLAYLAEKTKTRLLYVTFVRTVPRVYEAAYARLSPHTADRVEFSSLHAWAVRLLRDRGRLRTVDDAAISGAFQAAWSAVAPGTFLDSTASRHYWAEEVHRVVRGRSLTSFESYLDLERVGRGSRLGAQQRRVVWQLVQRYEAELKRRRLHDWYDVLRLARDEVRRRQPDPPYDAVVLDEAQDMPLVAAELLHALVGDRPDGLLLVGDDQQRVFPGGFRLSEAGIDVTGRSSKLTLNYRNTRQILTSARDLVSGEDDDLLEGRTELVSVEAMREGSAPTFVRAETHSSHDASLTSHLARLLTSTTVMPGDIAVLVDRRARVAKYLRVLVAAGFASQPLSEWDGLTQNAVIVGTSKSAKGLDFKHVIVPLVDPLVMRMTTPTDEYEAELWKLRRRELYVAMTRARDTLWVGVVASDHPKRERPEVAGDLRALKAKAYRSRFTS